jgi:deoxyribonuclease-2
LLTLRISPNFRSSRAVETPDGKKSSSYAHAKGVLVFQSSGGFWLIHSMPAFPDSTYQVSDSERIYGQSMLCVSVDAKNLNNIGAQLQFANPQLYVNSPESGLASYAPNLAALLAGTVNTKTAASNVAAITTRGGQAFTSFYKNAKWGQDLYQGLVAPYYKTSLLVETWMRPFEPSEPGTYKVTNVATMCLSGASNVCWKETNDHSKWAVSADAGKNIVCVGDINKQKSQWGRGGGTMCINNANLYNIFKNMITGTNESVDNQAAAVPELPARQARFQKFKGLLRNRIAQA